MDFISNICRTFSNTMLLIAFMLFFVSKIKASDEL